MQTKYSLFSVFIPKYWLSASIFKQFIAKALKSAGNDSLKVDLLLCFPELYALLNVVFNCLIYAFSPKKKSLSDSCWCCYCCCGTVGCNVAMRLLMPVCLVLYASSAIAGDTQSRQLLQLPPRAVGTMNRIEIEIQNIWQEICWRKFLSHGNAPRQHPDKFHFHGIGHNICSTE